MDSRQESRMEGWQQHATNKGDTRRRLEHLTPSDVLPLPAAGPCCCYMLSTNVLSNAAERELYILPSYDLTLPSVLGFLLLYDFTLQYA